MPALPAQGSTSWFTYAQSLDDERRTGRLSDTGLRAAFAPVIAASPGHRLVGLGDSITAADAYLRYLAVLAGGRIRFAHNAGVGGDQISQMLTRFDTDVTPYAPTIVTLLGGTNDYTFGTSDTDFRARVRSFVAKVRGIGAVPLLFTSPPCNTLADPDRAKIPRNNVWMAEYAARNGVLLVDAYAVLADPANAFGKYLVAYNKGDSSTDASGFVNDGIHPNDNGHWALAQATWPVLSPLLPPSPAVTLTATDPTNLLTNGLFLTNSGGVGTSWGQNWGVDTGTSSFSIVTDTQVPGGSMQRMALNAASGRVQLHQSISTGFSVGDTLRCTLLVTNTTGVASGINCACNGASGNITNPAQRVNQVVTRGLIDLEFVVPTGTTSVDVTLDTYALASGATGTADFGAVTLRNETVLGLLTP